MLDVAVVGGGPAGASAALLLARAGLETVVIDRAQFPRVKVCGEYLGAGAVAQLRELGLADLMERSAPIEGIHLSGNGVRTELRFSQPGRSVPREVLDDALLQRALDSGAAFLQAHVEDVRSGDGACSLSIRTQEGESRVIGARYVIAADGAHSIVARKLGLSLPPREEARFALGGHYAGFCGLEPFVEMFVEGASYFAVNPFDAARANVMVIVRENELSARKNDVDAFVRERALALSGNSVRFSGARLDGKRLATGPLAHATRTICSGNILLAGDAAAFIDPFTGQGVFLALRGGTAAARAIVDACTSSARATAAIERYRMEVTRELRLRARLAKVVRSVVRSAPLSKRAARNIERHPERAQHLVDAIAGCGPLEPALRFRNLLGLVA